MKTEILDIKVYIDRLVGIVVALRRDGKLEEADKAYEYIDQVLMQSAMGYTKVIIREEFNDVFII
jgi:hypothetical protein